MRNIDLETKFPLRTTRSSESLSLWHVLSSMAVHARSCSGKPCRLMRPHCLGSTNKHAAVCKPFLAACTNARNTEGPLCCESKGSEMEGRWLTCIHMTVLVGHVF